MEEEIKLNYLFKNANIHVDKGGNSYAVRDNKIIGTKGVSYQLPEVTISPRTITPWKAAQLQKRNWRQQYDMSSDIDTFNAVTGGVFNQLSPTQLVRNIYNISTNKPNWQQQFVFGNNGIVSDNYAQNNPIKSTAINFIGDMIIPSKLVFNTRPLNISNSIKPATKVGNTTKQYIPNINELFKHNAYLETKFYDKPVQNIIKQFRNMNTRDKQLWLRDQVQTLPENQQDQLKSFITTYNFQGRKVPYYTNVESLLNEHPKIEKEFGDALNQYSNAVIDVGDDYAVLIEDPTTRTHEAEHVLQRGRNFKETKSPYMQKQEDLLNKAYKHTDKDLREASLIKEKGAVNQELRASIIEDYYKQYGHYPTDEIQLRNYIDKYSQDKILETLKNANLYGEKYVQNKPNISKIKEALKYIGATTPIIMKKGED